MGIKGFLVSFVALGLHQMGAAFAARSTVGILGLAAVLAFVPFPDVTPDLVLTAVFGGFFLGAGIGRFGVDPAEGAPRLLGVALL